MRPATDSHSAKEAYPFIECAPPVLKRMSYYLLILQEKPGPRYLKTTSVRPCSLIALQKSWKGFSPGRCGPIRNCCYTG